MTYTKDDLQAIAKKHARYFNSVVEWNEFAAEMELPKARTFIYTYGTWNRAKKEIFLEASHIHYSGKAACDRKKELVDIAIQHAEHFEKIKDWNKHAEEMSLPYSRCYIYLFGSWNKAKEAIFGHQKKKNGVLVEKKQLIQSARTHIDAFTDIQSWNQYAEERDLPKAHHYIHHFGSWNEAKLAIFRSTEEVEYNPVRRYEKKELKKLAQDHAHHFTTKKDWDDYAKERELPRSETFANHFGGWNKAKKLIFKEKARIRRRRPKKSDPEKAYSMT
ncbi:hypothetical protein M3221_16080 [Domibacillus indicus]|uniref:hypothetical protein n=1 Tax=Domibacillus indicus TaxID=1437523 RepID=UPI00203C008A|nr:hypothetical protein [Domibacillus indicus]MCM3789910.1 hypothetical protein [Domibacillus indicus]